MHVEEISVKPGLLKMALINKDNTLFLGRGEYNLRQLSYTKDIHNFEDTDYWYAEFFNEDSISLLKNPDVLSMDALSRMHRGECILMLNNAHEAFHSVVRAIYDVAVKELGIPTNQITLISESAVINLEVEKIANEYNLGKINTEWMRLFEHDTTTVEHSPITTLEYKKYDKKFINFNRRWRMHRPLLVALLELNGLLDKGYVSLAKADDNKGWDTFFDEFKWSLRNETDFLNTIVSQEHHIRNIPYMTLDQQDMSINHAQTLTDSTDKYYTNTYFSVVSETNFFDFLGEGIFASEKIFRPVLKKHPFILVSRSGTLNTLNSIGYKTFDGIINESYDREYNDVKRILLIVEEIKRLCNLSDSELKQFLDEARTITEYNYNVLMNKQTFITKL